MLVTLTLGVLFLLGVSTGISLVWKGLTMLYYIKYPEPKSKYYFTLTDVLAELQEIDSILGDQFLALEGKRRGISSDGNGPYMVARSEFMMDLVALEIRCRQRGKCLAELERSYDKKSKQLAKWEKPNRRGAIEATKKL